jgi:hypothetical protein
MRPVRRHAPGSPGMRPGTPPTSFRCRQGRHGDTASCRILREVLAQIGQRHLRLVSSENSLAKRLLKAILNILNGFQTYTVASSAGDSGCSAQPAIQLGRTGRLVEIETCGADWNFHRDFMAVGSDGNRKSEARRYRSNADQGTYAGQGAHIEEFRFHINLR